MQAADARTAGSSNVVSEAPAGVIGGIVAGVAYLIAQVSLTGVAHPGSASEPLQRIAAILMGPNVAPPPTAFNFTVLGMALIIHFGLAMVFGRIVAALASGRGTGPGILVGGLVGLGLYAFNFHVIAPAVFPWFAHSITWVTVCDHALFGAVAAAVSLSLRRPRLAGDTAPTPRRSMR